MLVLSMPKWFFDVVQDKLHWHALVLELADRQVSETCVRKSVGVRVSPRALFADVAELVDAQP